MKLQARALPKLNVRLTDRSPLSRLLNARQNEQDFARMRSQQGSRLEQFHLKFTVTSEVNGRRNTINGRHVINFGSSNYLGFEQHPEVLYAAKRAIDELGTQTGCARNFSSHQNMLELENTLSQILGAEATLIGNNVSQIHAGVLPALLGDENSVLFIDKFADPSLQQAALIAAGKGVRVVPIDINDHSSLAKIIKREKPRSGVLIVDTNSTHAPLLELKKLSELCEKSSLVLYLDDSHGVGVFGEHGGGMAEACGLNFDNLVVVGSLEHAFGSYGGFVSAKAPLIDFLRVTSKTYISSGTLQPSAVEGALASARIARSEEGRLLRKRLAETSIRIRATLKELGFVVQPGDSPVLSVLMGRDLKTLMAGRKLFDHGIFLHSVLYPIVPRARGVLRISLTTLHTKEELERLVSAFGDLREYLLKHENPLRQAAHMALELGKARWLGTRYAGL